MGEPARKLESVDEVVTMFVAIGQAAEERCDRIQVIFQAVCAWERDDPNRDPVARRTNLQEIISQVRKYEITLEEFLWVGPLSSREIINLPWPGTTDPDTDEVRQRFRIFDQSAPVTIDSRGDLVSEEDDPESTFHFCRPDRSIRVRAGDEADKFLKRGAAQ